MNSEYGKIEGDFVVVKDFQLYGMITGNALVKNGGLLQLHGTVAKDLIVEEGGKAVINGTVRGNVINHGGVVDIYGVVNGNVNGHATIDANAVVQGVVNT